MNSLIHPGIGSTIFKPPVATLITQGASWSTTGRTRTTRPSAGQRLGFRVHGLGFWLVHTRGFEIGHVDERSRAEGFEFRNVGLGARIQGLGFRALASGFRGLDLEMRGVTKQRQERCGRDKEKPILPIANRS